MFTVSGSPSQYLTVSSFSLHCTDFSRSMPRAVVQRNIKMLARDSLVYFVVLFATQVVNTVTFRIGATFDLMMVSECISCISISRMMMNIRGLVAEDPDHTLYLQTLNFASNNSEDHPHRRGVRNPTITSDATAYEVA
jgi:hypothetical protein